MLYLSRKVFLLAVLCCYIHSYDPSVSIIIVYRHNYYTVCILVLVSRRLQRNGRNSLPDIDSIEVKRIRNKESSDLMRIIRCLHLCTFEYLTNYLLLSCSKSSEPNIFREVRATSSITIIISSSFQ